MSAGLPIVLRTTLSLAEELCSDLFRAFLSTSLMLEEGRA
jgi:hypothetical protein